MAHRLKVMVFVDWFYPGFKAGGPIQSCINLIDAFTLEWDIYVVTGDRDLHDTTAYKGIDSNKWTNYQDKAQVYYAKGQRLTTQKIRDLVRSIQPDVLYVNGMFSWRFSLLPLLTVRNRQIKTIIAPRGMLQQGAMQFKRWKKNIFLFCFRSIGLYRNTYFHATDQQEEKDIQQYIGAHKGTVNVPNFPKMSTYSWKPVPKQPGVLSLVYVSRISPKKNLAFILECLTKIDRSRKVSFTIAGEIDDEPYWLTCKHLIEQVPGNITADFYGPVPNYQLNYFYGNHQVFVLPTLGENYGHAIVEALLFGKPVIISDKTPWNHLQEKKIGLNIVLGDSDGFVKAIEKFADMPQSEYDEWSKAAWRFAAAEQAAANDLKDTYRQLFISIKT